MLFHLIKMPSTESDNKSRRPLFLCSSKAIHQNLLEI